MIQFVCYTLDGNLLQWGDCSPELLEEHALPNTSIMEGIGTESTHYVLNGVLHAYTPEEQTTKAKRPAHLAQWNNHTMSWVDLRSLAEIKEAKWTEIKAARSAAEYGGFVWNNAAFDSDVVSQGRITGAVSLAQISAAFSTVWVLRDNSTLLLRQEDMLQVGVALGVHVATQFAKGVTLRNRIEAAGTAAEVSQIVW